MRTSILRVGVVLVLIVGLLWWQGPPVGAQAVPKQLRIAVGIDADTLEPVGQTTTTISNIIDYFFETLVDMDFSKNPPQIVPKLATRWEISRDGLTYTSRCAPA